jgi:hypothetical protein
MTMKATDYGYFFSVTVDATAAIDTAGDQIERAIENAKFDRPGLKAASRESVAAAGDSLRYAGEAVDTMRAIHASGAALTPTKYDRAADATGAKLIASTERRIATMAKRLAAAADAARATAA